MARPLTDWKVKQVRAELGKPNRVRLSQREIAEKLRVSRHTVGEISAGRYRTPKQRGKNTKYEPKLKEGYCNVCHCQSLDPCVACAARLYQRLARERGRPVLLDGTEADLLPDLDGVPGGERRMAEVHGSEARGA